MHKVKCQNKECLNLDVEFVIETNHAICGVCNSILRMPTQAELADEQLKENARLESKQAVLDKLGLTAEEVAILLG